MSFLTKPIAAAMLATTGIAALGVLPVAAETVLRLDEVAVGEAAVALVEALRRLAGRLGAEDLGGQDVRRGAGREGGHPLTLADS